MPRRPTEDAPWSALLTLNAFNVGVWEHDSETDRTRCDAVMARIFGLLEAEAARGVTWERLSSIFHPDDLARDTDHRRRVRAEGGLFVWEHRIVPAPGVVRWVLARGRFQRGADGHMRGRGIVIDVTDSRNDGQLDGPARFLGTLDTPGSVAERMTESALRLWDMMHDLDAEGMARLRPLIRDLLLELGRLVAASLPDHAVGSMPPRDPKLH